MAPHEKIAQAFVEKHDLADAVVLKPDVGHRGAGVQIVRSEAELECYLQPCVTDTIIQEYMPRADFEQWRARAAWDRLRDVKRCEERSPENP